MDGNVLFDRVLSLLEVWSNAGDTTNEMGTRLVGHVPHVAPKAYVHVVYAPLNDVDMNELSSRLERPVPQQLNELLSHANGLSLFVGELRVLGYVPLQRRASTHTYNYPTSIVLPNVSARLPGLKHDAVVVGAYGADGSYVAIDEDGTVVRLAPKSRGIVTQRWPDFQEWLISEITRIATLPGRWVANNQKLIRKENMH